NRKDGIFSGDAGAQKKAVIAQQQATYNLDIEFQDYEAIPKANARQVMGSQSVDPVPEACADILRFFQSKSRNANPGSFCFLSNNTRRFNRAAWAVIVKDTDPPSGAEVVLKADVDRKENVINVTTDNVESFRIWLNDRIVDIDRPVIVKVNGKQ